MFSLTESPTLRRWLVPGAIAIAFVIILLATAGRYGIFGDELYYVANANHLDFGYVDHPPFVALITRLSLALFGQSLLGLRLWPALAGGAAVLLASEIARRLGGGPFAIGLAAVSVPAATSFPAFFGFMSMNAFDIVFVATYLLILMAIFEKPTPARWIALGLVAGIGLQTKLTMLVVGFATLAAVIATRQRRHLATPWPYIAGGIAFLIFLPNVIWQIAHGFPTLEFIRNAQEFKITELSPFDFLLQVIIGLNPLLLPLWAGGAVFLLTRRTPDWSRTLGILLLVAFGVFFLQRSKFYYALPLMLPFLAAGAVGAERLFSSGAWRFGRPTVAAIVALSGLALMPLAIPLLDIDDFIAYSGQLGLLEHIRMENHQQVELPQHFAWRFGWPELAQEVAGVYGSLTPEEQKDCLIIASNYGNAGAIDFYGPAYGLPPAASGHNNYWLWGLNRESSNIIITVGLPRENIEDFFESIEPAAVAGHPYAMSFAQEIPILICRSPKRPLIEYWPLFKGFG